MKFDTLQSRIALLFVAALVLLQIAVFVTVDWAITSIARDNLRTELDTDMRVFHRINDVRTQQMTDVVRVLSADFGFRQAVATQDHNTVLSALVNQSRRVGADLMMMMTPQGVVFANTGGPPGEAFNHPDLMLLAETRGLAHDIVALGKGTYRMTVIPVLAPLPIAYLAVGMSVDDNWAARLTREGQFNISFLAEEDQQWRVIGSSRPPAFAFGLPSLLQGRRPDAARPFELNTADGVWESVFVPLSDDLSPRPVAALLQRSLDENLKSFQFPRMVLLAVMLGSVLLFAIGAVILARSLTRPLDTMTRVAALVARGDYAQRVPATGIRELADLGRAFNRMAASLAASTVSRSYVENILQSMNEALIVTDAEGRIETANGAAQALFGYSGEELAGKLASDLFAETSVNLSRQAAEAAAGGAQTRHVVRRDGSTVPVEVAQSTLSGDADGPAGRIFLLTDLSRIRNLQTYGERRQVTPR